LKLPRSRRHSSQTATESPATLSRVPSVCAAPPRLRAITSRQPMRSVLSRVCPKCGVTVSALTCPVDGWATVLAEVKDDKALPPGSRVLDRFVCDAFVEQDGAVAMHRGHEEGGGRAVRIAVFPIDRDAGEDE